MSNHIYCEYNCGATDCLAPQRPFHESSKVIGKCLCRTYRKWWQFWKPEFTETYEDIIETKRYYLKD